MMIKLKELYVEQYAKLARAASGKYLEQAPGGDRAGGAGRRHQGRSGARGAARRQERRGAVRQTCVHQEQELTHRARRDDARGAAARAARHRVQPPQAQLRSPGQALGSGRRPRARDLAGRSPQDQQRAASLDAALVPTSADLAERAARGRGGSRWWRSSSRFGLAFLLELLDSTVKTPGGHREWRSGWRSSA